LLICLETLLQHRQSREGFAWALRLCGQSTERREPPRGTPEAAPVMVAFAGHLPVLTWGVRQGHH
jgi:hypothetical protein